MDIGVRLTLWTPPTIGEEHGYQANIVNSAHTDEECEYQAKNMNSTHTGEECRCHAKTINPDYSGEECGRQAKIINSTHIGKERVCQTTFGLTSAVDRLVGPSLKSSRSGSILW